MLRETGNFASCSSIFGYAASELAVEKASRNGSRISRISRLTREPSSKKPTMISTSHRQQQTEIELAHELCIVHQDTQAMGGDGGGKAQNTAIGASSMTYPVTSG